MGGQQTLVDTRREADVTTSAQPAVESGPAVGWWLVVEADDPTESGTIVGGPFPDRMEADWAVLTSDLPVSVRTRVVHGRRRSDGALVPQSSPRSGPGSRSWSSSWTGSARTGTS